MWTSVGIPLSLYWLMPFDVSEALFGSLDNSGMEMSVFSGLVIVSTLTLSIVFNARLLTAMYSGPSRGRLGYAVPAGLALASGGALAGGIAMGDAAGGTGDIVILLGLILAVGAVFSIVGQRFDSLAPALRIGIAYPLANRFRTGRTISVFR